jgi:hypothetical protein
VFVKYKLDDGVVLNVRRRNIRILAADYSYPGDNIPPVLAVAQHCGLPGADLVRGLAVAHEIQVDLVKLLVRSGLEIFAVDAHLQPLS